MAFMKTDLKVQSVGADFLADFEPINEKVREFKTLKNILDGNSEMVMHGRSRIKSLDCKVLSVLIEDALRTKQVEKVADDNFIFIRRAVDVKTRARRNERAAQRAQMGHEASEFVEMQPLSTQDLESKKEAVKRNQMAVTRLIHLHTSRMLDIIGYSTTESDCRRLEYAIERFGGRIGGMILSQKEKSENRLSNTSTAANFENIS
jgi:hypothetical protein